MWHVGVPSTASEGVCVVAESEDDDVVGRGWLRKGDNVREAKEKEKLKCQCMGVVTSIRETQNLSVSFSLHTPPPLGGSRPRCRICVALFCDSCCADALVSYAAFECAVAEWRRAVWMVLCRGWVPVEGRSGNTAGNCLKAVSSRLMDRLQMCGSDSGDFEGDTAARLEVTNLTADYAILKVIVRIPACGLRWLRYACLCLPAA